ncbi:ABC transporter permease [Natronospora cellulosivora (SeqCode)]
MSKNQFQNTGQLAKFILHRDRVRIPIWIIAITLLTIIIAPAFTELFPTDQDIHAIAETMRNPAMTAMVGPGYGLDNYTYGAMMSHMMLLFTAFAVAIMSIFIVIRHTRGDEESGRIEVICSLPVGRLSNLASTIIVSIGVNILLGLVVAIGLAVLGIESIDLQGSILYGAVLTATGIFFTAITALFAQLTENTRGAIGYSFTFLGLSYLLRSIGDVSSEVLSLISPLGLILRAEVYVNNYWWPVIITVLAAIPFLILAFYLNAIRDLEAGLIPSKGGRINASRFLQSPLGLALRLQRTTIISWLIGAFVLGASYGSVAGDLDTFLEANEMYRQIFAIEGGLPILEQFISILMSVIAIICAVPAVLLFLKLKKEEMKNRTEHLYARAVSRNKVMGSFLAISLAVGFSTLFLAAFGLWATAATVMEDPISFSTIFNSAMIYLPSTFVIIGISGFLIGFFPKRTIISWVYLIYSFFVVYLGGILQFPDWMESLSPYGIVPQLPIDEMNWAIVIGVILIALFFTVAGFFGYNRRDLAG